MKNSIVLSLLLVAACGTEGKDGTSCSTSEADDGVTLTCSDGTETFIANGSPGRDGDPGADGQDGAPGVDGLDGTPGADGQDGLDGEDGRDGVNGASFDLGLWASANLGAANSIVNIVTYNEDLVATGRCTGTKVTSTRIITAFQCNGYVLYIYDNGAQVGTAYGSDAVYYNGAGRDLMELRSVDFSPEGNQIPVLTPTTGFIPEVGVPVVNISMPVDLQNTLQVTTGFISDANSEANFLPEWTDSFIADYAASDGSAGAPVFSANGDWIGIHVGSFYGGLELSVALLFN
jgi:hypothetical protein